tara:strand:- start:111 stop:353 length:243 start_codon:yes stop_codon:yes gene_type:complete
MSETPVKIVVDLSKPKGQRESIIPLTDDEIAEREVRAAQAKKDQAAEDKVAAGIAAKKLSGRNKLTSLGLTEAEVTALLG